MRNAILIEKIHEKQASEGVKIVPNPPFFLLILVPFFQKNEVPPIFPKSSDFELTSLLDVRTECTTDSISQL